MREAPRAGNSGGARRGGQRQGQRQGQRLSPLSKLKALAGGVFVLSLLTGIWSLLRRLASIIGLGSSSWGGGLLAFMATLLVFGIVVNILGIFLRKRHPNYFEALTEAIRRLATGDFDVNLDIPDQGGVRNPLGQMVGEINLLAQYLKRMEDMRQEFISTASHEIQSPLTSIAGFARALREEGLSEESRLRYLGIIEEESGRLSRLAEGLLRLTALDSRGESPWLESEIESVALDEQIRSVILAAEPQWSAKGIDLDLDLEGVEARVDEDMIGQVWTNLFHNAVKFSSRGGPVAISLRREAGIAGQAGRAVARFADRGIGVSPEDLPFVFDRFFKADRSRTRAEPGSALGSAVGSGLGLAIAKKIVELHGGSIRAESEGLGKGSAFTVELPLAGPEA